MKELSIITSKLNDNKTLVTYQLAFMPESVYMYPAEI
jgi:hypothetical protein